MGLLFRNTKPKPKPKGHAVSTEDRGIVEINRLYDSEKRFRRLGDKHAYLIQQHHKDKAIKAWMNNHPGEMVAWDGRVDRYYQYDGKGFR
jgi:hypothetical protein